MWLLTVIGTDSRERAGVNLLLFDAEELPEFLGGLGLGKPECCLTFLLLFVISGFGGGEGVVSSSFKKGLLLNTFIFFSDELLVTGGGGLGALDFFIDDFLLLDLVVVGLGRTGAGTVEGGGCGACNFLLLTGILDSFEGDDDLLLFLRSCSASFSAICCCSSSSSREGLAEEPLSEVTSWSFLATFNFV
jgi:hypothetical protein